MGTSHISPEERFWARVDKTDTCWLWTGSVNRHGYGTAQWKELDGRWHTRLAHRIVFRVIGQDLPAGKLVLHTCDTPLCVRPDHLRIGSYQDNFDDMRSKGRQRASLGTQMHCAHGHERIPANRYVRSDGYDCCRVCQDINLARAYARRKLARLERKAYAERG